MSRKNNRNAKNTKKDFEKAIENGNLEKVQQMLSIYDPSADYNWAIRTASENGYTEIVKLLLEDQRVDPSDDENEAIIYACANGHTEVVRLLLADPRVDPTDDENDAFNQACKNNHVEIVQLLLADPRIDPSTFDNAALLEACKDGHIQIVKLLLADPRIHPWDGLYYNDPLLMAMEYNKIAIVKLLLADPRIDPSKSIYYDEIDYDDDQKYPFNTPLESAVYDKNSTIVRLLLTHRQINPTITPEKATLLLNDTSSIIETLMRQYSYHNTEQIIASVNYYLDKKITQQKARNLPGVLTLERGRLDLPTNVTSYVASYLSNTRRLKNVQTTLNGLKGNYYGPKSSATRKQVRRLNN